MIINPKWGYTPRKSPEDAMPLCPKFENLQDRIRSFDILKSMEFCKEDKIKCLSKWGFYFTFSKVKEYVFLCFCCGCANIPIIHHTEDTEDEDKDLPAHMNEITMIFYHFEHCEFIKAIAKEKWVADFQELIDLDVDVMPFDQHEKLFKDFVKERREEVRREKALKIQQSADEKKEVTNVTKKVAREVIPSCIVCKKKPGEVTFYPCLHIQSCIECAKIKLTCPSCDLPYSGLSRRYYDNRHMTVPVVNLLDID